MLSIDVLGIIVSYLDRCEDVEMADEVYNFFSVSNEEKKRITQVWIAAMHIKIKHGELPRHLRKLIVDSFDSRFECHLMNGKIHREEDLPALIGKNNGAMEWWINNQRHRDAKQNGYLSPTVIEFDRTFRWYCRGLLHRDEKGPDGYILPAVIYYHGTREWWKNGKRHRNEKDDQGYLPAIVFADGTRAWFVENMRHRDGDLPAHIDKDGNKMWYQNNKLHRDNDLPAVVLSNGTQEWWIHGIRHRDGDLPAIVNRNGERKWYNNGKLHREGCEPAHIDEHGSKWWFRKLLQDQNMMTSDITLRV